MIRASERRRQFGIGIAFRGVELELGEEEARGKVGTSKVGVSEIGSDEVANSKIRSSKIGRNEIRAS